jgi:O-antigen ligase
MTAAAAVPSAIPDEGRSTLSTKIVGLYVFLLFCRILEMLGMFGLGKLRLMMLVTLIGLVAAILTGNLARAVRTEVGILLALWTTWMIVSIPFGTWRSESLNQFANLWLKSLLVFFIVVSLASARPAFLRAMSAMGWAAVMAAVLVLPGLADAGQGNGVDDRLMGFGTLSNPNEIAFHLWLGMSFLVLLAVRGKRIKKLFLGGVCLLEMFLIVKTVSREGLLIGAVVILLALLRVSAIDKAKIVVAASILCVAGVLTLSQQSLDRYLTLFTSHVNGEAAASARESSRSREQKLRESVELTLRNPVFGVGMGVFMPASVGLAKEKGGPIDWQASHNSYTQVSSELGIPGILILLAILGSAVRQVWRMDREAKRAAREDIRQYAFAILIAIVVLAIHFCFDSMAYLFYMPLITGLATAFVMAYEPELTLARQPSMAASPKAGEERFAQLRAPAAPAIAVAVSERNPYRFGRRRSSAIR